MFEAHAGADRVGTFSPVVLTRILKRTADEARSGALQVVSGPSAKTVHFEHGSIRFAASNIRKDRLGESMLAHKFISSQDYERAVVKMKNDRCRFGEALVSLGRLTEREVHTELAIQVQRIVLSLFRIPEGTYSYDDSSDDAAVASALPFGLPVPPLMLKGLRAIDDGKLILSVLPPASTRVRVSPAPPKGVPMNKLSDGERSILQIAGEGTEIGDIVRRSELGQSAASGAASSCSLWVCWSPLPTTSRRRPLRRPSQARRSSPRTRAKPWGPWKSTSPVATSSSRSSTSSR